MEALAVFPFFFAALLLVNVVLPAGVSSISMRVTGRKPPAFFQLLMVALVTFFCAIILVFGWAFFAENFPTREMMDSISPALILSIFLIPWWVIYALGLKSACKDIEQPMPWKVAAIVSFLSELPYISTFLFLVYRPPT